MPHPLIREFRLAGPKGDGRRAYVNEDGAFIGCGVPLLERDSSGLWQPRGNAVLERLSDKGYGIPVELSWRATQLRYVANALNKGDLALACLSLVRAELPPLPSADHARAMAKADGILVKYNPDWEDELRVPEGDPAGGQWSGEGEDGASDDRGPLTFVSDGGASAGSRASAQGTTVTIEHPDGTTEARSGGTRSWRNNNPGNIAAGNWADRHGAIGSDGVFAIFPDEATGEAALEAELNGPDYSSLTIDGAIKKRTPKKDKRNDTERTKRLVRQFSGLPGDAVIGQLSPSQAKRLCGAIRRSEVGKSGQSPVIRERRARRLFIALVAIVSGLAIPIELYAADQSCLEYEPKVVTLSGTISRHLEYGPPNYGEDPSHDAKEIYWYLDLDKPICVNGKHEDSPEMERETGVQHLQIVYMHGYPRGRGWVNHRVTITGTLFHAISGHHHTRVLITADKTVKAR